MKYCELCLKYHDGNCLKKVKGSSYRDKKGHYVSIRDDDSNEEL